MNALSAASMSPASLSVIIVNWNTRDLLARCLMSIYRYPPPSELEVLVVDNGSTDGSAQMVREAFPHVRLIANRDNRGFARANNQAIRLSSGAQLLLLNSDAEVLPGSLSALLECATRDAHVGVVGGQLLNIDGSFQAGGNRFPTLTTELLLLSGLARRLYGPYFPSDPPEVSGVTRACDWVGGACLLARRAAVESVGLLDEAYDMYVEEVDWCYRMHKVGWKVVSCAEAKVLHHGGGSAERVSVNQLQKLFASKARFLELSTGRPVARLFRVAVRLVAIVQAVRWQLAGMCGTSGGSRRAAVYLRVAIQL